MLFPATLVVVLAIKGVNLVLSMTAGGILAISIGIPTGLLKISDVLKFENGTATGSVVDGISGFSGLIIFENFKSKFHRPLMRWNLLLHE